MRVIFLIFIGAGLGGVLRHLVNAWLTRLTGAQFPWGIFAINVSGSFAMGLAAGYFAFKAGAGWPQSARLFLTTGVLGGYTTFSTFSLDAAAMVERGDIWHAWLYVTGSMGAGIGALFLGLHLMER
jgi:CrcB protein